MTNEEAMEGNVKKALEKQIPKRPNIKKVVYAVDRNGNDARITEYYYCPVCGHSVIYLQGCSNNDCRQAIDWSDDNDQL